MAPRQDQLDPNSLRTRLRVWLTMHPGWHTPRAVAEGIGVTDQAERTALTVELNRLTRRGDGEGVTRYRPADAPKTGPGTVFARAGTPPPVTAT